MRIRKIDEEYYITGPLAAAAHVARNAIDTFNASTRERLCYRLVIATDDTREGDRAIGMVFGDSQEEADANHALFVAAHPRHALSFESKDEPDLEQAALNSATFYAARLVEVLALNFEVSLIPVADRLVFLSENSSEYMVLMRIHASDKNEFLQALSDSYLDSDGSDAYQFDEFETEYLGAWDSESDFVIIHVPIYVLNTVMPTNNQLTSKD